MFAPPPFSLQNQNKSSLSTGKGQGQITSFLRMCASSPSIDVIVEEAKCCRWRQCCRPRCLLIHTKCGHMIIVTRAFTGSNSAWSIHDSWMLARAHFFVPHACPLLFIWLVFIWLVCCSRKYLVTRNAQNFSRSSPYHRFSSNISCAQQPTYSVLLHCLSRDERIEIHAVSPPLADRSSGHSRLCAKAAKTKPGTSSFTTAARRIGDLEGVLVNSSLRAEGQKALMQVCSFGRSFGDARVPLTLWGSLRPSVAFHRSPHEEASLRGVFFCFGSQQR